MVVLLADEMLLHALRPVFVGHSVAVAPSFRWCAAVSRALASGAGDGLVTFSGCLTASLPLPRSMISALDPWDAGPVDQCMHHLGAHSV